MDLVGSGAANILLWGGSRSGKTAFLIWVIITRAISAPGSRHAIVRFRFNHVKQSIIHDTFPKIMRLAYPDVEYTINKTDWFASLQNGSEIWFGGLDDKERTEKILGMEFVTIFKNECSQITWPSVGILQTRLAQSVMVKPDDCPPFPMRTLSLSDCNPP